MARVILFPAARAIRRFVCDDSAAISVETVIVMPLLFFFYAGAFVFYDSFRSYNVTVKAAYAIGDVLSRQTTTITSDDIKGLERLYEYLSFSNTDPWIRLTEVRRTASGTVVTWSYATDGHARHTNATLPKLSARVPEMAVNDRVIVLETYSPYTPAINVGVGAQVWENVIATRSRFASALPFQLITS
jgi:Flp pilus assembly protein TadG